MPQGRHVMSSAKAQFTAMNDANNEADGHHSFDLHSVVAIKNRKAILTPGPGSLLPHNLLGILPCFGRVDSEFQAIESRVLTSLRRMTGNERIARMQGSASLALEIAIRNFVAGRTLLIDTGYYAERLGGFCRSARSHGAISSLDIVPFSARESVPGHYDLIMTVFSQTSTGLLFDIRKQAAPSDRV